MIVINFIVYFRRMKKDCITSTNLPFAIIMIHKCKGYNGQIKPNTVYYRRG